MKSVFKKFLVILCAILIVISSATTAFAHSGRTDSSGGHKDNKNKSGLGYYHYHCGGYPAHLHSDGYCPYKGTPSSGNKPSSSGGNSSSSNNYSSSTNTVVYPSSIIIKVNKTTLHKGESVSISAYAYPENAKNKEVTLSCSDTSVVSLNNGTITAKNYGTATITAKTANGVTSKIKIYVKEITANKVSISGKPETNIYIGDGFDLDAKITPENVDNPSIVWSSSNEEIATVSSSGIVNIIDEGKVEIRATASNGVYGKITINAKEKYVESVEIIDSDIDVFLGEESNVSAVVYPSDATHPEITWSVDDPSIVNVSKDGKITALNCGETIITATSTNGVSDFINIKVNEIRAEELVLSTSSNILIGSSETLNFEFKPNNTTDQNIIWSISDESIATISEDGVLTANKIGTVKVTATQKDVSATCTIEILPINVTDIQITIDTDDVILKDDVRYFDAKVLPEDATYPEITWSTSNPEIATIDNNGKLTALKVGTVNVIATSTDGFCSEYEVVISPPTAVILGACAAVIGGAGTAVFIVIKKTVNFIKSKIKQF